jgi:hypothetical protein
MRAIVALTVGLAFLSSIPAHAEWMEYKYPDLEIAKEFPAEPRKEIGIYKTPLASEAPDDPRISSEGFPGVPDVTYSVEQDQVTYRMTVVDFSKRVGDGANLLEEAASLQRAKGTVIADEFPRYDLGKDAVYGRMLTIDEKGGDRSLSAFFFNKGRLYIIQAIVSRLNPDRNTPNTIRFVSSLSFRLAGYGFDPATGKDFPNPESAGEGNVH